MRIGDIVEPRDDIEGEISGLTYEEWKSMGELRIITIDANNVVVQPKFRRWHYHIRLDEIKNPYHAKFKEMI